MPLIPSEEQEQQESQSYATPRARTTAVISTSQPGAKRYGVRRNETLDDLENDSQFMGDAELFLGFLGEDDDIFETLRDSDYNIYKGVSRAVESKNWPDEVKQAYARLRTRFDNADTGSFNQWIEATKDIGIDVITDPVTLATLVLSPFTGGASMGARAAAGEAAKVGVKRFAASRLASATVLGAADGAIWTGVDDWARQKTEESVGLRDSVSGAQVLGTAAVGGLAGGLIGRLVDRRAINKVARNLDETALQDQARIMFGERGLSKFVSKTVGKPATFLDPYRKVSPTAKKLQNLFRYDLNRGFSNPLNPTVRGVAGPDYFRNYHRTAGDYLVKVKQVLEPLTFNRNGRMMTSEVNDELLRAIRTGKSDDTTINKAAQQIRKILDEMKEIQVERKLIQENDIENYFPRIWNRTAIQKNRSGFERLLMEVGEAADEDEAVRIVDELLDKKNQITLSGAIAGPSFAAPRKFTKITDDSVFSEFLDNDVIEVLHDYGLRSAHQIAKVDTFGVRNVQEFRDKWLNPLVKEVQEKGIEVTENQRKNILDLYKYTTGEGVEYFDGKVGAMKDWTALGYQVSLLPLATLSSLTEIVIPLTRVNTPTYLKGLAQGMGAGFKNLSIDMLDMLKVKHGFTKPQAFRELNRFMIAVDQGVADGVERLAGEGLRSKVPRKLQNAFFKTNLLTQWTHIVQASSYIMGKDLISSNLKSIAKAKNRNSRSIIRKINELADLGVDYKEGIKWIQRGGKLDDPFYNKVQEGASVFVNEIILPTSREAGTKPHIMSNPKTDILFQFMGYPAAFTNIVLKNMAKEMGEHPIRGTSKILAGASIMTLMARYGNWIRSQGTSEEGKEEWEIYRDAVARWGGNGLMLDMMRRGQDMAEATQNPMGYVGGFVGPLPGEVITSIAYRRGPAQILGSKAPGYGAGYAVFGEEVMDDYNSWLREQDKKIQSIITGQDEGKRIARAKGGLVNVPQAPDEPDERIDKMTGLPYKTQAGTVMHEEDDPIRRMFSHGGPVRKQYAAGGLIKLLKKAIKAGVDAVTGAAEEGVVRETTEETSEEFSMALADRMQRAKEMGFDTDTVYYHGTDSDFEFFEGNKPVFLTEARDFADDFSTSVEERTGKPPTNESGPNVIPLIARKGRVFDTDNLSEEEKKALLNHLEEVSAMSGREGELQYLIKTSNNWELVEKPSFQKWLREQGYDSFYVKEGGVKNLAIFNPKNVRSINARFDPKDVDDPRLLKNKGGLIKARTNKQIVNILRNSIGRTDEV